MNDSISCNSKIDKRKENNQLSKLNKELINGKGNKHLSKGKKIEEWGLLNEYWAVAQLNNSLSLRKMIYKKLGVFVTPSFYKIPQTKKTDLMDKRGLGIQVKASKSNFGQVKRCKMKRFFDLNPELRSIQYIFDNSFKIPLGTNGKCIRGYERKRLNTDNYSQFELDKLLKLFEKNKRRILIDVFLGNDAKYAPKLFLVIANSKTLLIWKTKDIIEQLSSQKWKIGNKGTTLQLDSGNFCLQRKGGDSGKKSANDIQFKLKPCHLDRSRALVVNF